jgi:DNA-binding NarL/FixJ family response regulator
VRSDSRFTQRRILVIDDFEPWRRLVCSILGTKANLRVVGEGADGLEAVQKAQKLRPDLILLDIGLPRLNGIRAAEHIRHTVPGAKILFLTAVNDEKIRLSALGNGAMGCVWKPDAGRELLSAVAAVLRGHHFVSGGANRCDVDRPENVHNLSKATRKSSASQPETSRKQLTDA